MAQRVIHQHAGKHGLRDRRRADAHARVVAAGMSGYLVQGQRAQAAALWNRYPKDVEGTNDIGLRLLYAHAFALQ